MANQGTRFLMEIEVDPALFDETPYLRNSTAGQNMPSFSQVSKLWYILQYQKTSKKRLIYVAIDSKNLIFTTENPTTVFFREGGGTFQTAHVVYIAESYKEACQRIQHLKFRCFEKAHLRTTHVVRAPNPMVHEWLLLQYFTSLTDVKYRIIKRMDTVVLEQENVFPHSFAYIKEGGSVTQGMIVRSSYNVKELKECLEKLRTSYVDCNAFIGMELSHGVARGMYSRILHEDVVNSLQINALEAKMHDESTQILTAFADIADLKKRMTARLADIRKKCPKK